MDQKLIEQYKQEMLNMYHKANPAPPRAIPTQQTTNIPLSPTISEETGNGKLTAVVTTLRAIYPLEGARVTVFTGNYDNMEILVSALTDSSGKSPTFSLPAPPRNLSESPGMSEKPYASYNMLVEADGYLDNIHLNIPVFSGVESVQQSNMMLRETAGENKNPQIFDEAQQFNL